jgi:hypothetical protein
LVPREVSLTFSASIGEQFAQVAVVAADGTAYQAGPPVVRGDTVTQRLDGVPAQGQLSVNYRVVSSDGHPVSGSVPFTVDAAAEPSPTAEPAGPTATPTAAATPEPETATPEPVIETPDPTAVAVQPTAQSGTGGAPSLWLLGGAAALVLGGLAVWFVRRRPRGTPAPAGSSRP